MLVSFITYALYVYIITLFGLLYIAKSTGKVPEHYKSVGNFLIAPVLLVLFALLEWTNCIVFLITKKHIIKYGMQ